MKLIAVSLLFLLFSSHVYGQAKGIAARYLAQIDDEYLDEFEEAAEEFIDDFPVEEPYYEELLEEDVEPPPPPPPPPPPSVNRRDKNTRFRNRPNLRNKPSNKPRARNNSRPSFKASSDKIEFRLSDPPLYWVGEEIPKIPKNPK